MTASDEATCLIVIAVHEFTTSVIQNMINDNKRRRKSNSSEQKKGIDSSLSVESVIAKSNAEQMIFGKTLNSLNLAHVLERNPLFSTFNNNWERCTHSFNAKQRIAVPPNFMSTPIEFPTPTDLKHLRRRREFNYEKSTSAMSSSDKAIAGVESALYQFNVPMKDNLSNSNTRNIVHAGDDMFTGVQESIDKGASNERLTIVNNSESVACRTPDSSVHSLSPRVGGRGKGKDLAALRKRRSVQHIETNKSVNDQSNQSNDNKEDTSISSLNCDYPVHHPVTVPTSNISTAPPMGKSAKNLDTLRQMSLNSGNNEHKSICIVEKCVHEEDEKLELRFDESKRICQGENDNMNNSGARDKTLEVDESDIEECNDENKKIQRENKGTSIKEAREKIIGDDTLCQKSSENGDDEGNSSIILTTNKRVREESEKGKPKHTNHGANEGIAKIEPLEKTMELHESKSLSYHEAKRLCQRNSEGINNVKAHDKITGGDDISRNSQTQQSLTEVPEIELSIEKKFSISLIDKGNQNRGTQTTQLNDVKSLEMYSIVKENPDNENNNNNEDNVNSTSLNRHAPPLWPLGADLLQEKS